MLHFGASKPIPPGSAIEIGGKNIDYEWSPVFIFLHFIF